MSAGLKLDEVDVGILQELQSNSRVLYKELAKRLGISLPTVRARIKRLRDLGIIKKFTLVVDPDKFYGKVRALLLMQVEPTHVGHVSRKLSEMQECREVHLLAGSYNLAAKIEVNGVSELGELTIEKLQQLEGIMGLSCLVIAKTEKEEYGASIQPEIPVRYKCDFCGGSIVGKPYVEIIHGGRYYFTGAECAEAFKSRLEARSERKVA